jgi:hypothetical protein
MLLGKYADVVIVRASYQALMLHGKMQSLSALKPLAHGVNAVLKTSEHLFWQEVYLQTV